MVRPTSKDEIDSGQVNPARRIPRRGRYFHHPQSQRSDVEGGTQLSVWLAVRRPGVRRAEVWALLIARRRDPTIKATRTKSLGCPPRTLLLQATAKPGGKRQVSRHRHLLRARRERPRRRRAAEQRDESAAFHLNCIRSPPAKIVTALRSAPDANQPSTESPLLVD
jgi:hypothetical protein